METEGNTRQARWELSAEKSVKENEYHMVLSFSFKRAGRVSAAILSCFLFSALMFQPASGAFAQAGQCLTGGCTFGGSQFPGGVFSTTSSSWTTIATNIWAGEWQEYSVLAGNTYEWSLCAADGGNASYDAQLTLYNTSRTPLCYSDDLLGACGDDSKIQWTATFTGNVRTRVNQYNCAVNTTSTTLVWRMFNCQTAINIPSLPVVGQALSCASANFLNEQSVPAVCGAAGNAYKGGNEALYTFSPSTSGAYTISISGQTWTSIFLYSGSCPASGGTCIGSVGNDLTAKSVVATLTAGTTYYLWFDTWPSPTSPCPGTFSITPNGPANDVCTSATPVSAGSFSATTVSAAGTDLSSCGFSDTEDVWFTTTNSTLVPRRLTVSTGSSSFDPVLAVYSGTCAGLTELGCDDDGGPGTESLVVVDCIQPGQTVYIRLSGYNGGEGTTTLTLSSTPDPVAPTLTCPANITVNAEAGYCEAYVNYLPPWADSSGAGNYTGGGVLYDPIPGTGTSVTLSDDQVSGAIPIGFSFNFYGSAYTNAYISSNGFLSFDASAPNGCCSGQVIPDATAPNNLIAFAWEDLNPSLGGTIRYFTTGSAPNRIFVVNFNAIQHHPGGNPVTAQVQLQEGLGVIEIHTMNMPSDGGNHTMGIENATGFAATYVTGRLASNWSTGNEGIQFIPPNNTADNCGLAYTVQTAGNGFSEYFDVGTTTETYRITDLAGNVQTCSFTVTVVDNQAPFVNLCPPNITVVSDEPDCGGRIVNYTQQFGDNCHGYVSGSLVTGLASGALFPIGTTPVSWTFDDGNGNPPATCSFNVTVTEPTVLSSELNLTNGCASCSVSDGQTRTFYDQNGDYLMTVQDDLALPSALGATTVCNLAAAAPTADDELGDPVPVLARFWRVTPTVNGPADLTVHFTTSEYDAMRTHPSATGIYAITGLGDVCFTRYANGTPPGFASPGGLAVPVQSIINNGDGTISAVLDMAGFSDIYCHACSPFGGPLPVTLLSFTGQKEGSVNLLRWVTATESGVSHFELARASEDGAFSTITQVPAAGVSTENLAYAFEDRDFPVGGQFYRLRTVELDGSDALSQIVFLDEKAGETFEWAVFPNPAVDQAMVTVTLSKKAALRIRLVDAIGQVRFDQQMIAQPGEIQIPMNLANLPEGFYQVYCTVEGGTSFALPLFKAQP